MVVPVDQDGGRLELFDIRHGPSSAGFSVAEAHCTGAPDSTERSPPNFAVTTHSNTPPQTTHPPTMADTTSRNPAAPASRSNRPMSEALLNEKVGRRMAGVVRNPRADRARAVGPLPQHAPDPEHAGGVVWRDFLGAGAQAAGVAGVDGSGVRRGTGVGGMRQCEWRLAVPGKRGSSGIRWSMCGGADTFCRVSSAPRRPVGTVFAFCGHEGERGGVRWRMSDGFDGSYWREHFKDTVEVKGDDNGGLLPRHDTERLGERSSTIGIPLLLGVFPTLFVNSLDLSSRSLAS